MAYEEAKQLLRSYKRAQRKFERLCMRVQRLEAIDAPPINYNGMPRGTQTGRPTEAVALMLTDAKTRKAQAYTEMQKAYDTVQAVIESLEDERQRDVLELCYLEGLEWDEIAAVINYTERHAHRIHAAALCEVHMKMGGFDK